MGEESAPPPPPENGKSYHLKGEDYVGGDRGLDMIRHRKEVESC